jgi:protocatechuate 3,4-dioxygenase beta subunit
MTRAGIVASVMAAVVAAAVWPLAAQSPTTVVRGRVVSDETGEPLANVRIAAPSTELGMPVALTDDNGQFTLTLGRDATRIIASKTGYGRRQVDRAAGATTVNIRLQRGAVVSGRVVDEYGDPVQAARVSALDVSRLPTAAGGTNTPPAGPPPPPGAGAVPNAPSVASTDTDDRGEYRLPSLPAGTYAISIVTLYGMVSERVPGTNQIMSYPGMTRAYYPNATTIDDATRLALGAGEDHPGVDFVVVGAQPVGGTAVFVSPLRPPPLPAGTITTAIVRGHVIATDGRSLPHAQVKIFRDDMPIEQSSTRADADGQFELRNLPKGTFRLLAVKTGYGPVASKEPPLPRAAGPFGQPAIVVTLAEGETRERVNIPLLRWGTLEGRVVDERGEPVQGASVQLMQIRYEAGRRRLASASFSRPTDDLGRYRLFAIPPGRYAISAAVGDVQSVDLPGYARTYYPGSATPGESQFLSVGLAQDLTGIDIPLTRTRTARIRGRMVDAAGEPTLGGSVNLISSQRSASLANVSVGARIQPNGEFEFANVPPGQYVIQAYKGRSKSFIEGEFGTLPVSVDGSDLTDLRLQTSRGSTIHGHVTFDTADASKQPSRGAMEITPTPVDFDLAPPSIANADIHDDWTFDMAGITGPRRLQLTRAPSGWMLEDMLVNRTSVVDRTLTFGRGDQSLADLEVVLTDRISELAGTLTDDAGQPAAGAHVVVFPTDRDRWYPFSRYLRTAVAGADGTFSIPGLPFASYYAAAVAQLPNEGDDAWQDASFLNSILLRASSRRSIFGSTGADLPPVRRDTLEHRRKLRVCRRIDGPVLDGGARRILPQEVVAFPIRRRPDRSRHEPAAAVRTDVTKDLVDARRTKRALVGTDPRVERVWWQRLVAVFAGWSELEHGDSSESSPYLSRSTTSDPCLRSSRKIRLCPWLLREISLPRADDRTRLVDLHREIVQLAVEDLRREPDRVLTMQLVDDVREGAEHVDRRRQLEVAAAGRRREILQSGIGTSFETAAASTESTAAVATTAAIPAATAASHSAATHATTTRPSAAAVAVTATRSLIA